MLKLAGVPAATLTGSTPTTLRLLTALKAWPTATAELPAPLNTLVALACSVFVMAPFVPALTRVCTAKVSTPPTGRLARVITGPVDGQLAPPVLVQVMPVRVRLLPTVSMSRRSCAASGPVLVTVITNVPIAPPTTWPDGGAPVTCRLARLVLAVPTATAVLSVRSGSLAGVADRLLVMAPFVPNATSAEMLNVSTPLAGSAGTVITGPRLGGQTAPPLKLQVTLVSVRLLPTVSMIFTSVAMSGPALLTVIVKTAVLPPATVPPGPTPATNTPALAV